MAGPYALTTPALPGSPGAQAEWTDFAAAATAGGYRPDRDLDWETLIAAGDGQVHVSTATGSDDTGTGTPSAPFATLARAILSIPHNRTAQALRIVTVNVEAGETHTIPTHWEALSLITILGSLPTAAASGSITTVHTTTTEEGIYILTDIAYTGAEQFTGFLIQYESGKWGQVAATYDSGGFVELFATQAVNYAAYDTLVATDTFDLYDPDDLCEIQSANTAGAGTNFNQSDNLKFRRCKMTSAGGSGKLVFYQCRVNFQDCHIGPDIGRVYVNNGSLTLANCYIETEGEGQEFGMVGAGPFSVLNTRGGTVFNGNTATTTNNWPVAAAGSARFLTSGPIIFRLCRGPTLTNGAQVDYSDGYSEDVSWYFTEQESGAPFLTVDFFASGAMCSGTIPDIHGDTEATVSHLVQANAPCQLWLGQGTDINVVPLATESSKPVSTNDGAGSLSGDAHDGSFIRSNRARSTTVFGPTTTSPTALAAKSSNLVIDWLEGVSQTYDLSDASNDTSATVVWYFDNPVAGAWHTLKLVEPITMTHDWTSVPVLWAGGVAPTLSAGSGDVDLLRFYFDGTNWLGEAVVLDAS